MLNEITNTWVQDVVQEDMRWTQCVEGYSLAKLDEAIALVEQHGMKVRFMLCSRKRMTLLAPALEQALLIGSSPNYKGIEFRIWDIIHDDYLYVIGDTFPCTEQSVAVMVWRRAPSPRPAVPLIVDGE